MYTPRMRVCQTYITVFKPRLCGHHMLLVALKRVPISFALILELEFAKKRLQCRDTKI